MAGPIAFQAAAAGGGSAGGRPKLEHAFLQLHDPPSAPGTLRPGPASTKIDFQFNPKELSITKSAKWNREAQRDSQRSGVPEFKGAEPCKLTLEMFLDATEKMDDKVVKTVEQLFACCVPTADSHARNMATPPIVVFHWGGLVGFPAYVKSVQVRYSLFTPGGLPVRGTAQVSLEEFVGEQGAQNPTSGGLAARKVHTIVSGDTLPSIAYREYGDAAMWRPLAAANGIDDPMRLLNGSPILVPAAEELDPFWPDSRGSGAAEANTSSAVEMATPENPAYTAQSPHAGQPVLGLG